MYIYLNRMFKEPFEWLRDRVDLRRFAYCVLYRSTTGGNTSELNYGLQLQIACAGMIVNTDDLVECVTTYSLSSRLRLLESSPGVARIRPALEVST
jgi:hypothetical protein